jgi:hypothetical protein
MGAAMTRISVGRAIGRAYGFFFGQFLEILGLSWLPAAFFAAVAFWWIGRLSADITALTTTVSTGMRLRLLAETGVFVVSALFFSSVVAVSLARAAIDGERSRAFAYFVVGARELRLFLASFALMVLLIAAIVLLTVAMGIAVDLGLVHWVGALLPGPKVFSSELGETWRGIPVRAIVAVVALFAVAASAGAIAVRLGFLLPPLAAEGGRAILARAARASHGNFWRTTLVMIVVAVPVFAIAASFVFAIIGRGAASDVPAILSAHVAALATILSASLFAFVALTAGASAAAWRAIGAREIPSDPVPPEPASTDFELQPAFAGVHPLATLLPDPRTAEAAATPQPNVAPERLPEPIVQPAVSRSADLREQDAAQATAHAPTSATAEPPSPAEIVESDPATQVSDEPPGTAIHIANEDAPANTAKLAALPGEEKEMESLSDLAASAELPPLATHDMAVTSID